MQGIILGTGHNALVLQAYLARSGVQTVSLERRAVPGGGLTTEENPRLPGFWHNTHSFFHRAITSMPWYRDLELDRHGARYVEPDLNVALVLQDGRVLHWWRDLERTVDSFARFSSTDAAKLRKWAGEFRPVVEEILIPEAQSPPVPPAEREQQLQQTRLGRRLLEVSRLSPLEFVQQEFEHDVIRAGLLFFNGLREVDLRLSGFGHSIAALLASPQKAQMCLGGSARLASALVSDIEQHGGQVRTGVQISRMIVQGDRVTGVELATGERIEPVEFVASGLNPQQTFLELLPESAVDPDLRTKAENFEYNLLAPLFALNLALTQPPRYAAAEAHPELDDALMVLLGLERLEQFGQIVSAHEQGRIPPTVMWGACPTRFDPSQAPPGQHTAFMWEKLPYRLDGSPDNWESQRDAHAREMLKLWSQFAPNLNQSTILDWFARTPVDTQRQLPNMRGGDLLVGSFAAGQLGYHRPFAGAGRYRTRIGGLYLCGGSTHPGGNITGLCGYNAAGVIAADLGVKCWWK